MWLAGLALLILLALLLAADWLYRAQVARTYERAPACGPASNPTKDNCVMVLPGEVTAVDVSSSKGSSGVTLGVAVGQDAYGARLDSISPADQGILSVGTQVEVTLYKNVVTAVGVQGHHWSTSANPTVVAAHRGRFALLTLASALFGLMVALVLGQLLTAVLPRAPSSEPPVAMAPPARIGTVYPLAIRPRSTRLRRPRLLAAALALALVELYLQGGWILLAGFMALAATLIIGVRLFGRSAGIYIDDFSVTQVGLLGRRRVAPRNAVARIVLCTIVQPYTRLKRLLFLARDGHIVSRLSATAFAMDEIAAAAQDLAVPMEGSWDDAFTFVQLQARFPGAASWSETHRQYLSTGVAIAILAIVTVWALILTKH